MMVLASKETLRVTRNLFQSLYCFF